VEIILAMERIEEILNLHHWPAQNSQSTTSITGIENFIGFYLPEDYIYFLNNFSGYETHIGLEYVKLWGIDEIIEENSAYRINSIPNTLGIGNNGASEFIGIEILDKNIYRMVISPYIDLDPEYHIGIGTSFTDFLERLNDNKQWFETI
jgi:hypothetical protein